jgi:ABC-2 type transport system ATP-binding protein
MLDRLFLTPSSLNHYKIPAHALRPSPAARRGALKFLADFRIAPGVRPDMSVLVETKNLTKSFGPILAVDDLSFSVAKGEVLGFLGPNGAGKSTTMKMLACFLAPTSGAAAVGGHDILADPMAVRRILGYLPESAPAYSEMTVESFLRFVGRIRGYHGAELSRRVAAVVEKCFLKGVRFQTFETLSKGYKRRVGLAQALIHDPPVLILDEPTDGLDPNQKHEVRTLISEMARDKVIILSTHILEEVEAVCSRAAIIAGGRLVADETPERLRQRSILHGAVTLTLRGEGAREAGFELSAIPGVDRVEPLADPRDGFCDFRAYPQTGSRIAADVARMAHDKYWEVEELTVERGRLDEVFRDLTGGVGSRDATPFDVPPADGERPA